MNANSSTGSSPFSHYRRVNKREVDAFPINLDSLGAHMQDLEGTSENKQMTFRHDTMMVQCIDPKESKTIIDELDALLGSHYGFPAEKLDFIVNCDIKYRLGRGPRDEEDEE